ncbi:MAG: dienelactone hydrolase family protein [Burkholderiaceae bacterium]|jgi:phospholipase/carboxylesterase|nr:dienelactone hydrolase family protein [Burkholderiaceae bacterium]MEB2320175.1 dienelactone hydrolase family protein [Pseudomonadota bacterium]
MEEEIWIELPPINPDAPRRLIVFLHEHGSDAGRFAPVGVAWQLKFPGAVGALINAGEHAPGKGRRWFAARPLEGRADRIAAAVADFRERLAALQDEQRIGGMRTMLVGFGQGATVALEAIRGGQSPASIVVAYAARLGRPVRPGERIDAAIHLVHGTHDTLVPLAYARQAQRGLAAAGALVTLDILADGVHSIDQEMVNLGTRRAMQSVFRNRHRAPGPGGPSSLH